jgi:hypothetical protein
MFEAVSGSAQLVGEVAARPGVLVDRAPWALNLEIDVPKGAAGRLADVVI